MESKGLLHSVTYDREQHELVTLQLDGKGLAERYDELVGKTLKIIIEEYKEKRSRNANSYMWELCGKLAKLNFKTKEEIYRDAVKAVGVYKVFYLRPEDKDSFIWLWEHNGTAWLTEKVDYDEDGDTEVIRAYYGSSCYNSKQMARLIDYLVQDCKACGIPILSAQELTLLLDDWHGALRKDEKE